MEILEAIKIVLPIFVKHKDSDWETLCQALDQISVPTPLTDGLLEFMPLAFGRVFLNGLGIEFSDYYIRYEPQTERKQNKKLIDNLVYKECFEAASHIVAQNAAGEAFVAVALRSPEVKAVNDLLLQGSQPENLVVSPPHMQWSEDDKLAESLEAKNEKSWRRFWK